MIDNYALSYNSTLMSTIDLAIIANDTKIHIFKGKSLISPSGSKSISIERCVVIYHQLNNKKIPNWQLGSGNFGADIQLASKEKLITIRKPNNTRFNVVRGISERRRLTHVDHSGPTCNGIYRMATRADLLPIGSYPDGHKIAPAATSRECPERLKLTTLTIRS